MDNIEHNPFPLLNLKWVSLALLIVSLLFVYFIPRAIMYPDIPSIGWIIFAIIFFIIPVLVFIVLKSFTKYPKMSTAFAFASVLIVGPTFGIFQGYREKAQLLKDGQWVKGIIIDHSFRNDRTWQKWVYKCQYSANQVIYQTSYHDDKDDKLVKGDTINIIFSKSFPKIYSISEDWKQ